MVEEEYGKLWSGNKADHLCQSMAVMALYDIIALSAVYDITAMIGTGA